MTTRPSEYSSNDLPVREVGLHHDRADDPDEEISFVSLANVLLRNRRLCVALPLIVGGVFAVLSLARPRMYTASASFMPQAESRGIPGGLAGMASQLGLNINLAAPVESPLFYEELIMSRELLTSVTEATYTLVVDEDTVRGDLMEVYAGLYGKPERPREPARVKDGTVRRLRGATTVRPSRETAVVRVEVRSPSAALSTQLVQRILESVNEFNLSRRQSRAGAERKFVEERLSQARSELLAAEHELQEFLQRNRTFQNSPELTFRHDRLQREVDMRQQIYTSLGQAYEQARIEEARDVPIVTILDRPVEPVRPEGRKVVGRTLFGLLLGGVIAVVLAFARDLGRRNRSQGRSDYEEFAGLVRDTRDDLLRPLSRARAVFVRR